MTAPSLRLAVFERDGYICRYCGSPHCPPELLIAEHVAPKGPTDMENLVAACRTCNKVKGTRTPDEAGMPLLAIGEIHQPPIRYSTSPYGHWWDPTT